MSDIERVTVTLPAELVRAIDLLEKNRSRFVTEAVRRELRRRRRDALRESLQNPHRETGQVAEEGFAEWSRSLPAENGSDLFDADAGTPVRWVQGKGWIEDK